MKNGKFYVYLIHQREKLGKPQSAEARASRNPPLPPRQKDYTAHAGHYTGATNDLDRRRHEHANDRGAWYMGAVNRAGITWAVVRTWEFDTWEEAHAWEKWLKEHRKNAPTLCPECNPKSWKKNGIPNKERV